MRNAIGRMFLIKMYSMIKIFVSNITVLYFVLEFLCKEWVSVSEHREN